MKRVLCSLATIGFLLLVVGCGKSNKLIGTWKGATNDGMKTTWIFEKKDVVKYENEYGIKSEGKYAITDDVVSIDLEVWSNPIKYKFEINDGKLNLEPDNKYSPSYSGLVKSK